MFKKKIDLNNFDPLDLVKQQQHNQSTAYVFQWVRFVLPFLTAFLATWTFVQSPSWSAGATFVIAIISCFVSWKTEGIPERDEMDQLLRRVRGRKR